MAIKRPYKWQDSPLGFREWSDADIEGLSYATRAAYAAALQSNSTTFGGIFVGNSGETSIGSFIDTRLTASVKTAGTNANLGPTSDPIIPDFPATHGSMVSVTTNYRQNRSEPNAPVDSTFANNMWAMRTSGVGFEYLSSGDVASTITDLEDTIINECLSQMRTGDLVGTYYVATSAALCPGGAVGWTGLFTFHTDTRYGVAPASAATDVPVTVGTTATLFIKTSSTNTSPPAFFRHGTGTLLNGSTITGFKLTDTNHSGLVGSILLPLLQRKIMGAGGLSYEVKETVGAGETDKGAFVDTIRESGAVATSFTNPAGPTYFFHTTPNGTVITAATTRLVLL